MSIPWIIQSHPTPALSYTQLNISSTATIDSPWVALTSIARPSKTFVFLRFSGKAEISLTRHASVSVSAWTVIEYIQFGDAGGGIRYTGMLNNTGFSQHSSGSGGANMGFVALWSAAGTPAITQARIRLILSRPSVGADCDVTASVDAGGLEVYYQGISAVAPDAEEEKVDSPAVNIIPIGTGGEATRLRYKVISGNLGDFTGSFTKDEVKLYPY
jgi:hypothetical protein